MGERGESVRYAYWSDRTVRSIANDGGININPLWKTKVSLFKIPVVQTGIEVEREPRTLHRKEIASRIERGIGDLAVEDFVTPPPTRYARGVGRVEFSHFVCEEQKRVVLGVRSIASDGTRVAVCLFGSRDNVAGFMGPLDPVAGGWSSSSMWSVREWLAARCAETSLRHDDMQSISVEAMKIAFDQGFTQESREATDRPWMRGYTFGDATDSEWFAEIHSDVVLDKDRWSLDEPVDRIVVGAPLWVRTPRAAARRYRDFRTGEKVRRYE
ncbi:hypothetical protein Q3W71_08610 [Micromonospora sp. C28SCA-DRY-2]|uniref:hypothetical protein n=1 Tax=Micromonospora sp. C28SCA-DRY-2 TaxID=3059522 RepID=UPI00267689FB|nr:hypothetical protein [Micromonospora sp. C28SCA-DRY-2]MDO3701741.1 hypothetical protein [Micromonospora sp. C28SCA-DRY-2]